jgi:hypothetical protein
MFGRPKRSAEKQQNISTNHASNQSGRAVRVPMSTVSWSSMQGSMQQAEGPQELESRQSNSPLAKCGWQRLR